ncbi:hypothetical protein [Xanthomonas citri]|uniref:hypothetical protein n=1 Tax=Xanthomonas citri TaxID=346 RepID=UPI000A7E307F|nr:hypothetical protein [Xanthomonas citri]QTJ32063.1 hypothetical protein XcfCFBP6165P_23200 [Xanthomonas citri pv. phaseoli var. fuscans]QTL01543.1 hypothetical protein J4T80_21535 [Xanthomonas citri pv. fuscans]
MNSTVATRPVSSSSVIVLAVDVALPTLKVFGNLIDQSNGTFNVIDLLVLVVEVLT